MNGDVPATKFHWMDLCIKCDKGGKVMICHENGCPIAVHQNCLGSAPQFDEMGNFYCPYCVYKRTIQELSQAERKAMLAEKTLSKFLDENGEDKEPCKTAQSSDVLNQPVHLEKDHQEEVTAPECSARDKEADASLENKESDASLENRVIDDTTDSTSVETETISEEVTGEKNYGHIEKSSAFCKSSKVPRSFKKFTKRKRVPWKVEEEEMLKKGVQKFSTTVNKKLPWQKILEEGRDVFDETRAPTDLKDKWRYILSKEPLFEFS